MEDENINKEGGDNEAPKEEVVAQEEQKTENVQEEQKEEAKEAEQVPEEQKEEIHEDNTNENKPQEEIKPDPQDNKEDPQQPEDKTENKEHQPPLENNENQQNPQPSPEENTQDIPHEPQNQEDKKEEPAQNLQEEHKEEIPQDEHKEEEQKQEVPETNIEEEKKEEAPETNIEEEKKEEVPEANTEEQKQEAPESNIEEKKEEVPEANTEEHKQEAPESNIEEQKQEAPEANTEEQKQEAPETNIEEHKQEAPETNIEEHKQEAPETNIEEHKQEPQQIQEAEEHNSEENNLGNNQITENKEEEEEHQGQNANEVQNSQNSAAKEEEGEGESENKDNQMNGLSSNRQQGGEESENYSETQKEQNSNAVDKSTSHIDFTKSKQVTLENVNLLYKSKIKILRKLPLLTQLYDKYWQLLPHTFEGEITKDSYISLFRKIYKVILPIFNYGQIDGFVEGDWLIRSKCKDTMNKASFGKALFSIAHLWCVHVDKYEYENFLSMLYGRITKVKKIYADGTEKIFYPSIKVKVYSPLPKEEYDNSTWEIFYNQSNLHSNLYEVYGQNAEVEPGVVVNAPENANSNEQEPDPNNDVLKARPLLFDGENSRYSTENNFLVYDEEAFYEPEAQKEIEEIGINEHLKYLLNEDENLVIFGYPTQFIMNKFINEPSLLESIESVEENEYDSTFFITDFQPYETQKIYLKLTSKDKLISFLQENQSFTLLRDVFIINTSLSMGSDFSEDECNVANNLRRNIVFDRYINMHEIKLQEGKTIKANLDNLIINPTYKKAFGNILNNKKIGTKSDLWAETIEEKLEKIFLTKFYLIHEKILNLNLNYELYEQIIDVMKDEISAKKEKVIEDEENEILFFDKFKSKYGIKWDNWDSDNDLYDEANKKSPVVLVVGPPLIGKTSVSEKLAKDLEMVLLEPSKFFEAIFAKVAEFEEKMANWEEENAEPEEQNQEEEEGEEGKKKKEEEKPKKVKPGVDSVLTPVEFAVYTDITNGGGISELNMQRMYQYILHSDLAFSRGVVIDMNSNIYPKTDDPNNDTDCFVAKILNGYFGAVTVDYVVDLTLNKEQLEERMKKMKLNMKTLKYISPREIELMEKPKVAKKEILEDEIEYDEEGKEIVPEPEPEPELGEEELEKIPKKEDLVEITDFSKIFEEQYDYFQNVQHPKVLEYVETLKKNYYIQVDVEGLDFDEVANLVKARLDFANPPRAVAKPLESADFKSLLMDGREGVLPFRRWSAWKQIDPVALKDEFLLLTGNTEFPAAYFGRVFLFVSEENRKKFLDNPKKYISAPPQVPINYRISIIGPAKSGKKTIAKMLSELYGWKIIDMEEIFEKVKEYQKTWEEPELNSVYTRRVHFSASEFKDVLANMAKKAADRKPDNFVSKIVFMCDYLGIPLDKKKTKEQFFAERKYHSDKLAHMFTRMKEAKERAEEEEEETRIAQEEEEAENQRLAEEEKEEEKIFPDMTECARSNYDIEKAKKHKVYLDHVQQKEDEKVQKAKALEEKEKQNPFPAEEDYVIEDLKSDQFFLAFDNDGNQPRVNGIILLNHPFSEDECDKLKDFNIVMDRVIYINDQSDEGIKALITRRNPNFETMDEEKQGNEIEKFKTEQGKFDEVVNLVKERYNVNGEECLIEVGYNEPLADLKLKLINAINPFSIRVDNEDKVIQPADVPADDKFPLSRGPFGLFCPVVYKEDNWLFYSPEANEVQVNQRVYRLSGEKEMEKFRANPALYLGENGSMLPIDVPPPHIMFTGYQGAGVTFFSDMLCKEYRLTKREIQKEFMEIWEKQKEERKQVRIAKKREELQKQNEEIEEKNKEALKENPEAEPEPLVDIEDAIKNDEGLNEEAEDYNAVDNDKEIFKSLFFPLTPTVYDASWNNMEEKVSTPFIDLLTDCRRVPNVMVIFKVSLKSIMDRHFHLDKINAQYDQMVKESNEKRKKREEDLIAQKRQEIYDQMKEQFEQEQAQEAEEKEKDDAEKEEGKEGEEKDEENKEGEEEKKEGEGEEEGEDGENKPKKIKKLPDINTIKVTLEPEEKDDIWNSPDPDLIEKDALIQQEKDKLVQRHENNMNAIQTLIDTLKERGIPVIEITNDTSKENVYKNLLVELKPYIKNRRNLIEKQLVNAKEFPNPLLLRRIRELYTNSEVYLQSVYGLLSPVAPHELCIRTEHPVIYRDRVYMFNKEEERKEFIEYPLNYITGVECPKDAYPMRGRTIIFTIGHICSGKTTLAKLMSNYMGYKRITVRKACMDLIEKLHDCELKREIDEVLYKGSATDDNLVIKILNRRVTMEDMINENIVIDGFPYTLSQANFITSDLKPDFVFVAETDINTNTQRALKQKMFKGIKEVVNERMKELGSHLVDILNLFEEKEYDVRFFDMSLSKWALRDLILDVLQNRKKFEMKFARSLSMNKPCELNHMTPKRLIRAIIDCKRAQNPMLVYSAVALKLKNIFLNNKHKDNSTENFLVYTPGAETNFHFLSNSEEVEQFCKHDDNYKSFLASLNEAVHPPKILKPEVIAAVMYRDEYQPIENSQSESEGGKDSIDELNEMDKNIKLSMNIKYEYQDCCPVTRVEDRLMKKGRIAYSIVYLGKYYKFMSMEKMKKFKINPNKYINLELPVKKVNEEENKLAEKEISFANTVNFLEFTFGSLITKGMLELSNNRIKYPYLNVKETSLKYLALFLKANNPNNNAYAKKKYGEILREFVRNSELPFELLNVFENYNKEKENPLNKKLIRKQLDSVSSKYDELMEKAKIQNNTRFENFFRRQFDN